MSFAAMLTELRRLYPDDPVFVHPDTGERSCLPITELFARVYVEWGVDRAEWFANWGV